MSDNITNAYTATIGIECHVQLKTTTKLFSGADNDAREAAPNTLVNHIDFGLPGALPVLNDAAVPLACRAAFALGTRPQKFSKFDRKHYFYPDLPMGYQITQYDQPVILGGHIEIKVDGQPKTIGITRAHLEADAGKSTHPAGTDYSLVDLNRAGTPLLEVVSEPDMHSAAEAKAFARELYLRMKYAGVSDANLYYGNMRFDVNVSVSKTSDMGTRTETKNLNSFRSVEKAVEYEISRQIKELDAGNQIIQETRGWDDSAQKTFSQRSKEDAHDYRYFPDPDLPPVVIEDSFIEKVQKEMPVLPDEWRSRLSKLELSSEQVELLLDAEVEFENVAFLSLIDSNLHDTDLAKFLANWNVNVFLPLVRDGKLKLGQDQHMRAEKAVYDLVKVNKLSSTNAKALFERLISDTELPADIEAYAQENNFVQESDEGAIAEVVATVISENPKAAEDVKNGEMKAIGFLTGQVMKLSQGKANPALAQELIKKQLGL